MKENKMTTKRYYGCSADLGDARDLYYSASSKIIVPDRADLRAKASPVEDQGAIGSCVAQALVGALELLDRGIDSVYADLSRLFLYYNLRAAQGTIAYDSGGTIRGGIKALASLGVCREKLWPYATQLYRSRPPLVAYKDAFRQRVSSYFRVTTANDIYQCLAAGFPVVFGASIYTSFESVGADGLVPMPKPSNETMQGGHAMCIVGFDKPKKLFLVRNSWGSSFGDKGYCWFPEAYLTNTDMTNDLWTIRTILNTK
jgi:C1A family cysteine protease